MSEMWKHVPTISSDVVIFSKNNTGNYDYICFENDDNKYLIGDDKILNNENFYRFISKVKFEKSTVGNGYTNKVNESIRKSSESTCRLSTDNGKYMSELFKQKEFLNMFPLQYHKFMENTNGNELYGKILEYKKGNFFSKHTDGKASDVHFQTIVVLPPRDINQFEGGELVFYTDAGEIVINNEMLTEWLFIIFRTTVLHECKPVTEGTRYSFAFKYEMEESVIKLFKGYKGQEGQTLSLIPFSKSNIDYIINEKKKSEDKLDHVNSEIEELQQKLFELENTKKSIEKHIIELRTDMSVLDVNTKFNYNSSSGIIVLTKYYQSINSPEELISNHRLLYNYLLNKYKVVHVRNYSRTAFFNEELDEEDDEFIHNFKIDHRNWEIDFDYYSELKKIPVFYENNINDGGEIFYGTDPEKRFEYNDSTYDIIAENQVTIIYFDAKI